MAALRNVCLAALFLASALIAAPAQAQDATYPIVIKHLDVLRKAGIGFQLDDADHYKNMCYDYGGGSYRFSVSDALLERYVAKGFTLESLCLGLVSEVRFDPETGKRLPTFVLFFIDLLRDELKTIQDDQLRPEQRKYRGRDPERMTKEELIEYGIDGYVSEELPLALPACFKKGTPYSDCTWRYAVKSGERLSDQSVEKFRNLGRAIEAAMRRARMEKPKCTPGPDESPGWPCAAVGHFTERGYLQPAGGNHASIIAYINDTMPTLYSDHQPIPEALLKGNNAEFFDVHSSFPRGFGYALYAQSGLGPGGNNSWLRERAGGTKLKSQVTQDLLLKHIER